MKVLLYVRKNFIRSFVSSITYVKVDGNKKHYENIRTVTDIDFLQTNQHLEFLVTKVYDDDGDDNDDDDNELFYGMVDQRKVFSLISSWSEIFTIAHLRHVVKQDLNLCRTEFRLW